MRKDAGTAKCSLRSPVSSQKWLSFSWVTQVELQTSIAFEDANFNAWVGEETLSTAASQVPTAFNALTQTSAARDTLTEVAAIRGTRATWKYFTSPGQTLPRCRQLGSTKGAIPRISKRLALANGVFCRPVSPSLTAYPQLSSKLQYHSFGGVKQPGRRPWGGSTGESGSPTPPANPMRPADIGYGMHVRMSHLVQNKGPPYLVRSNSATAIGKGVIHDRELPTSHYCRLTTLTILAIAREM